MNIFLQAAANGIMVGGIYALRYEPDADFRSYEDYQFLPGRAADAGYVHILCSV